MFHFNNGDLQWIFDDGFILMLHHEGRYLSCQYGDDIEYYGLPINEDKLVNLSNLSTQLKYRRAMDALHEVKVAGLGWSRLVRPLWSMGSASPRVPSRWRMETEVEGPTFPL